MEEVVSDPCKLLAIHELEADLCSCTFGSYVDYVWWRRVFIQVWQ